jgi:ATP-dependent RNA helicase DDX46/PRP5
VDVLKVASPQTAAVEIIDPEEEKRRKRKEKLEQWKREKIAKESLTPVEIEKFIEPAKAGFAFGKKVQKGLAIVFGSKSLASSNIPKKRVMLEDPDEELQVKPNVPVVSLLSDDNDRKKLSDIQVEEDESDPLEMFMSNVSVEIQQLKEHDQAILAKQKPSAKKLQEWLDEEIPEDEEEFIPIKEVELSFEEIMAQAQEKARRVDVFDTDHSMIDYEPFRKDFYMEPPDIKSMTQKQADDRRIELDGIKIRGKVCPKPVERWSQFGL